MDFSRLRRTLDQARQYLQKMQYEDGSWRQGYSNGIATGMYLLEEVLTSSDISCGNLSGLSSYILNEQNRDGSWSDYTSGQASVNATVTNKLALEKVGELKSQCFSIIDQIRIASAKKQAEKWLLKNFGSSDPAELAHHLSAFSFMLYLAVDPREHEKLKYVPIKQLFRSGFVEKKINENKFVTPAANMLPAAKVFFGVVDDSAAEIARIRAKQDTNGLWDMSAYGAIFNLFALHRLGLKQSDTMIRAARAALSSYTVASAEGIRLEPFRSSTWNAYFFVMGELDRNEENIFRRDILDALNYLLDCFGSEGLFQFVKGSEGNADIDTTGLLAQLLARVHGIIERDDGLCFGEDIRALHQRIHTVESIVVPILKEYQGASGGWSAYVKRGFSKPAGATHPNFQSLKNILPSFPVAMADVHTADVTAHALFAFGALGLNEQNDSSVAKAIDWLERDFVPGAGWWGRWFGGYTYGTAEVLSALSLTAGVRGDNLIREAITLLITHQNPDGGWGELTNLSDNPENPPQEFAMKGPSTPFLTARVLLALMSAGVEPEEPSIEKGINYLLSQFTNYRKYLSENFTLDDFSQLSHEAQKEIAWADSNALYTEFPTRFYSDTSIVFTDAAVYQALAAYLKIK